MTDIAEVERALGKYLGRLKNKGFKFAVEPAERILTTVLASSPNGNKKQVIRVPHVIVHHSRSGGLPGPLPAGVSFKPANFR